MNEFHNWTPEQAWMMYQWIEKTRQQLLSVHQESIDYYQWRERRMDEYVEQLEQMTGAEREENGVWLEPKDPDSSF
jgi:hypothetical protein